MPAYYEDKEEDNRTCAGIKEDLKACLLQHDCVLKVRMSTNVKTCTIQYRCATRKILNPIFKLEIVIVLFWFS